MKVGFSFGRCLRDIVNGTVDINDVLVIIARTYMETPEHVHSVVGEYLFRPGYLLGLKPEDCIDTAMTLWDQGKIHQPRISGRNPHQVSEQYLWMDLSPSVMDQDEMVKDAWNHYRAVLNLMHGVDVPKAPTVY